MYYILLSFCTALVRQTLLPATACYDFWHDPEICSSSLAISFLADRDWTAIFVEPHLDSHHKTRWLDTETLTFPWTKAKRTTTMVVGTTMTTVSGHWELGWHETRWTREYPASPYLVCHPDFCELEYNSSCSWQQKVHQSESELLFR